jgi:hypothetical protein
MAKWIRPWTRADEEVLRELLAEMKRRKPAGWSVVLGPKELVLRPPDRERGKFAVMTGTRDGFWIHFFDRSLNHWQGDHTVPAGPDAAAQLLAWAAARVGDGAASAG